jgi:DNA-binding response OmpR family regulator
MASLDRSRHHVLIVDAEPEAQRGLVELCRQAGLRVSIALDGAQAYQRAVAGRPNAVLMDVQLPTLDGFAACRLLKSDPATASIPVLFFSDNDDLEQRLYGLRNGGADYMVKPCDPREILARLHIHLNKAGIEVPQAELHPVLERDEVLVRAARHHLSSCLAHPPTLAELARHLGCGEKRLMRAFRAYAGMTVFQFIREERIRVAKRLLSQTSLSMLTIAQEVGFSSAPNFATAFRVHTGVTPSAFRDAVRQGPQSHPANEGEAGPSAVWR